MSDKAFWHRVPDTRCQFLDEQDFWWSGIDYVLRDEDGEIGNAGCILPSERFMSSGC